MCNMSIKMFHDGSKHDYSIPQYEVEQQLIKLILKIYRKLDKREQIYVRLLDNLKDNDWKPFEVDSEVFLDADYGVKYYKK